MALEVLAEPATGQAMSPKLGDIVLLNTPARPIGGRTQFAAIVTEIYDEDDTIATVFMMAGSGLTNVVRKVRREDTINRAAEPNVQGWEFRPE